MNLEIINYLNKISLPHWLLASIVILLFIYLFIALFYPERFT